MSSAFEMIFHPPFNGLYSFFLDNIGFATEKRLSIFVLKFSFLMNIERWTDMETGKSHRRWFEKHFYIKHTYIFTYGHLLHFYLRQTLQACASVAQKYWKFDWLCKNAIKSSNLIIWNEISTDFHLQTWTRAVVFLRFSFSPSHSAFVFLSSDVHTCPFIFSFILLLLPLFLFLFDCLFCAAEMFRERLRILKCQLLVQSKINTSCNMLFSG